MSLIEYDLFDGKVDKVKIAIERLKHFEPKEGYFLAFSGDKCSKKSKCNYAHDKPTFTSKGKGDKMNKNILIGICGKKRSGKGVAAQYIIRNYAFAEIYFAGYLKEICYNLFGTNPSLNRKGDLSLRDRKILQRVGTEFMRSIDDNCWVNYTMKLVERACQNIVIPDVRFPNEARAIKNAGGYLIRLQRDVCKKDNHSSETALDSWKDYDKVLDADITIMEMYKQIDKFMIKIRRKK